MGDDGWHSHLQVFAINLCVLCTCLYVLLLRILCVYINSCTSIYIIFRTMHEKMYKYISLYIIVHINIRHLSYSAYNYICDYTYIYIYVYMLCPCAM